MISRRAGFTLIEVMIVIAIIAILATVAAPSMRDMVRNARMTSLVNDLMTDLSVARAEAVKRGVRTTVCTSNTGTGCTATEWRFGWIMFAESNTAGAFGAVDAGEPILKIAPVINGANENPATRITSVGHQTNTGSYIAFRPTGVTNPGGAGTIDFYLCDARNLAQAGVTASEANGKGRHIVVSGTGRAQQNRCTCSSATLCAP
ncbi:MAG TPA: GspH/FimT family protein [Burkholderiales bacterium]|jgi:type IV fimbrial biogenesis protein FimT|nr:GspH/FimT family protein [Burkholderiales bacterium]